MLLLVLIIFHLFGYIPELAYSYLCMPLYIYYAEIVIDKKTIADVSEDIETMYRIQK